MYSVLYVESALSAPVGVQLMPRQPYDCEYRVVDSPSGYVVVGTFVQENGAYGVRQLDMNTAPPDLYGVVSDDGLASTFDSGVRYYKNGSIVNILRSSSIMTVNFLSDFQQAYTGETVNVVISDKNNQQIVGAIVGYEISDDEQVTEERTVLEIPAHVEIQTDIIRF